MITQTSPTWTVTSSLLFVERSETCSIKINIEIFKNKPNQCTTFNCIIISNKLNACFTLTVMMQASLFVLVLAAAKLQLGNPASVPKVIYAYREDGWVTAPEYTTRAVRTPGTGMYSRTCVN